MLLDPSVNWHPTPARLNQPLRRPGGGGGGGGATPTPPTSGYYPSDLLSAYGLATAAASFGPGPSAPTIAIVDAYDDPNAASDLAAYRASLSGATDPSTGLVDGTIPPLCSSTGETGCVSFTKVNQSGGTSYPKGNTGWAEEISLDLDMASAVCPDCNVVLVEASSASMSNLAQAVTEAESFHPAVITNSYGGSELSSETSYNTVYAATSSTAVTVATGDSGYGAEFPATSPGVTAVGGTSLSFTGTSTNPSWSQSAWSGAGSGCSAYEAMPSWQQVSAYSEPSVCTGRQVGDIAAVADPSTGVAAYDTYGESGWLVFGGTSVSTQVVGAAYGLAAGSGTASTEPSALYTDATGGTAPTPGLTPVTSGSNGSCGSYLCDAADSLSSGYNGPTGLGTLDGLGALQATATSTSGTLSLSPASETTTAGTSVGPISVDLSAKAPSTGLTLTVSTTSNTGGFSTSSSGPFTNPLGLTVTGGQTTSPSFYYEDATAGTPTLTASATGWSSATMSATVSPGPLATITVSPSSATVAEGGTQAFTATGADQYGNTVGISPSWTVSGGLGTFSPLTGASTTFSAGSTTGSATVTASVTTTAGTVTGTASVDVTALPTMTVSVTVGTVSKRGPNYHVPLTVAAASASGPISGALATLEVYAGQCSSSGGGSGSPLASTSGTTGSNGTVTSTFTTHHLATYCAVANVTDSGYIPASASTTFSS